ncbi:uncharacterized protein BXZ73DRAFT_96724 [Epithele typhae]|uniref:uncharacterized protein n=1 Tax=Epithele typhae TaxID=378194 RepID=UPI002008EB18|nr:uncharacterized protein BXZ73DRAFT_96724 [Epithele typhae]KAH9944234.1 hypothetical protein BXZ73DRAFT_96724 [Epithele typhae]
MSQNLGEWALLHLIPLHPPLSTAMAAPHTPLPVSELLRKLNDSDFQLFLVIDKGPAEDLHKFQNEWHNLLSDAFTMMNDKVAEYVHCAAFQLAVDMKEIRSYMPVSRHAPILDQMVAHCFEVMRTCHTHFPRTLSMMDEDSADEITRRVRNQLAKAYLYNHKVKYDNPSVDVAAYQTIYNSIYGGNVGYNIYAFGAAAAVRASSKVEWDTRPSPEDIRFFACNEAYDLCVACRIGISEMQKAINHAALEIMKIAKTRTYNQFRY